MIRLVILDVDGVLTDGRLYLDMETSGGKTLFYRDFDAIAAAQEEGLSLALLTGEDDAMCRRIADRVGIARLLSGYKDKIKGARILMEDGGVPPAQTAFVGDSDRDARAFGEVGLSFAPADASPLARQRATFTLHAKGGSGAVAEALEIIRRLNAIR